jgi:methyl-accepting chemotaxis protein
MELLISEEDEMKFIQNRLQATLTTKLTALCAVFVLGLGIVTVTGWLSANRLGNFLDQISDKDYPAVRAVLEMEIARVGQADDLASYLASQDEDYLQQWHQGRENFEKWQVAYGNVTQSEAGKALLAEIDRLDDEYDRKGDAVVALLKAGREAEANRVSDEELGPIEEQIFKRLDEIKARNIEDIEQGGEQADATLVQVRTLLSSLPLAILVVASGLAFFMARGIVKPLKRSVDVAEAIAGGKLDNTIDSGGQDETGQLLRALADMQTRLRERIEADRRVAGENSRIRQALDNVSSSVMVANADHDIIYLNDAAEQLFRDAEQDIRMDLPAFNAAQLKGGNIDVFHKNPGHQRRLLDGMNTTHKTEIKMGKRTFGFIANPVVDEENTRLGTVVEWAERTQELKVEKEVQGVVEAALAGDLSQRIDLAGKTGFFAKLSKGMNALVEVNEQVIKDTQRVLSAIAKGDLTATISADYQGVFEKLKNDANATVAQLTQVIAQVKNNAGAVSASSQQLNAVNTQLGGTAEETSSQANAVSAAAEEVSTNIEGVATAAEEMTASVREVANNAAQAARVANEAVQLANQTDVTVRQLSTSSNDIGNVIKVITSIAEQTNLLALNATIEAARAGEAGKGFAVVANEVKELAKETAKATEEIGQKIATIQGDSSQAVDAIANINKIINQISDFQTTIASAVEQQTATTNEISRNVAEAAKGSGEIAQNITQVAQGTQSTLSGVTEAQSATDELARMAGELQRLVEGFKVANAAVNAHKSMRTAA